MVAMAIDHVQRLKWARYRHSWNVSVRHSGAALPGGGQGGRRGGEGRTPPASASPARAASEYLPHHLTLRYTNRISKYELIRLNPSDPQLTVLKNSN